VQTLDSMDRSIVNALQGGFPICPRPYAEAAKGLGLDEDELIRRIGRLVEAGVVSRFGPLWNAERLGGEVCLCAMAVPADQFDAVATALAAMPEVAHNYERDHALNMWFVVSSNEQGRIANCIATIERVTELEVLPMPKLDEYFVGFRVEV
jgi:siroheme decarboxylase